MDYETLIAKKHDRIPELESEMSQEGFYEDPKKAQELTREYNRTKSLLDDWKALEKARTDLADNTELAKSDDADMAEMAADEIPQLERKIEELESRVQYSLLPHDQTEDRDAIIFRASKLERLWTRMTGDFEVMELCEFSFSEEVTL